MKKNKILFDDGLTLVVESTKGRTFMIDKDDEYILNNNWTINTDGYCIRRYTINKKVYYEYLHRLILNCPENMLIDHRDTNTSNNCKSNLRICTHKQNMRNQTKQNRVTYSKYKGVSWTNQTNKWSAQIKKNKVKYNLGYFIKEEDAALAYNKKAIELFGEFSKINII